MLDQDFFAPNDEQLKMQISFAFPSGFPSAWSPSKEGIWEILGESSSALFLELKLIRNQV